jgi:Uma2 family endonuclease
MVEAGILSEEEKVELINGELIEMSPIRTRHASCVDLIAGLLNHLLWGKVIIRVQNPVNIDTHSIPEPDIAVLLPATDRYAKSLPMAKDIPLIIEVSDSTLEFDREIKQKMYASAGIPEYWIINLNQGQVEAYRNPSGNMYRDCAISTPGDPVVFHGMNLELKVEDLLV